MTEEKIYPKEGKMFLYWQLRKNRVHQFQPKVEIYHEKGPYILKTVTNSEELIEALHLRYQIFHREMIGKTKPRGIDVDEFDFSCDHLIILDRKSNRIVGTYRLNCSLFSDQFYSAREFNLKKLMKVPGTKTELGRACIAQDFRNGIVISLLWRGIAEYMAKTKSEILFGCASIKTESPQSAALLYRYFEEENRFPENYFCPPTLAYSMPKIELWQTYFSRGLSEAEQSEARDLIPSLFRAYLKVGVHLGGEPAYDAEFKCIDFLTILERENLNKSLWRKYNLCPKDQSSSDQTELRAQF